MLIKELQADEFKEFKLCSKEMGENLKIEMEYK